MKLLIIIAGIILLGNFALAAETKLFTVSFDATRLKKEQRGDQTLFKYKDPACTYVEQKPGAPVLPSIVVNVVMPRGSVYKSCKVSAQTQALRGTYQLYTLTTQTDEASSAERYPVRLVDYMGSRDVDGYTVFSFRAYPILCQPADGSVAQVLMTSVMVTFEQRNGKQRYAPVSEDKEKKLRSMVVNPDDVTAWTDNRVRPPRTQTDTVTTGRTVAPQDVFAERPARPVGVDKSARRDVTDDLFDMMKEDVYINDDNRIVYAPIRF